METEKFRISDLVPRKRVQRIFAEVFDEQTINTLHSLASKGYFEVVEFVVSTGKEAHVFRAVDKSGNYRAIKIYKIATSDFKHMQDYIEGDPRFKDLKKSKRDIVFAWTRKEFRNLERASEAGVHCPVPYTFKNNVLVMEYIGDKEGVCLPVREKPIKDWEKGYKQLVEDIAKLFVRADLVHSDLSEYNLLVRDQELVLIDFGQSVLRQHPKAQEFFKRDLKNLANFLSKRGFNAPYEAFYGDVKQKAAELE